SSSDDQKKYRSDEELAALVDRDPILQTEKYLVKRKIMNAAEIADLRESIKNMVNAAADDADSHGLPDPATATTHIYSENTPVFAEMTPNYISPAPISVVDAINHGLREEMER